MVGLMVHKIRKKSLKEQELAQTETELKKILEESDYKVYTILRHVSSSGMFRVISCFVIGKDGRPRSIDWYIEKVLGYKRDMDRDGLRVSGAGMDMGFHVVYGLSEHLYRNPDGSYSHEGAYKLKQEWV
jgi:hypothetical protein